MEIMTKYSDGFMISEKIWNLEDLAIYSGPAAWFTEFKIANLYEDIEILKEYKNRQ